MLQIYHLVYTTNGWKIDKNKVTKTSPVDNSSMTPDSGSKTLITPNEEYGEPRGT